jgi:8-oxo-dGTP pyrophosphatase MutT (NUDIX family)
MAYIEKVTAFITRNGGQDLLLIQHPDAGIQLPAGTVEEDESPERAVLREVREETGLESTGDPAAGGLRLVQYIGLLDEVAPEPQRYVLRRTPVYSRPNQASIAWAEFRRGIQVQAQRHEGEFVQAAYTEPDHLPDPQFITYQITGWVPEATLCAMARRYFFHLELAGSPGKQRAAAPDRWSIYTDNHIFQFF